MKYELYQQVALAKDIPEKKLQRGDIATIVDCHPASHKNDIKPGTLIVIQETKARMRRAQF